MYLYFGISIFLWETTYIVTYAGMITAIRIRAQVAVMIIAVARIMKGKER